MGFEVESVPAQWGKQPRRVYIVRAEQRDLNWLFERAYPTATEAHRHARMLMEGGSLHVTVNGEAVEDECAQCLCKWDRCDNCGEEAYCASVPDAPDGRVPVCGKCVTGRRCVDCGGVW